VRGLHGKQAGRPCLKCSWQGFHFPRVGKPLCNGSDHTPLILDSGKVCCTAQIGSSLKLASLPFLSLQRCFKGCGTSSWSLLVGEVTRVNSPNVLDEGLRIGGIGRRMNSKVKISQTMRVLRINMVINLAYSQSIPDRPLMAPIYRWPGLKEPVGSDTHYNVCIRYGLIFWQWIFLGLA
jgi:hypothetical protein